MRFIRMMFVPVLALVMLAAAPQLSQAQVSVGVGVGVGLGVGVSVHVGPPALPVYVQPVCPGDGYLWTPGYWAYGPDGYYWVPGTWVEPPQVGVLWTPGYWGWGDGAYLWHGGYWGPHIGFYGGINYGFGYGGVGYGGGRWDGGHFTYNTAVNNVNVTVIHNTYVDRTVVNNTTVNRVSFNGGTGGIQARPTSGEQAAEHEQHFQATANQAQHEQAARGDRAQLASVNHGAPAVAATARPGAFSGAGVVRARSAGAPGGNGGYRPPTGGSHEPGGAAEGSVRGGNAGTSGGGYRPPAAGGNRESVGASGGGNVHAGNGGGATGGQPEARSPRTNAEQGGQHGGAPSGETRTNTANTSHASAPKGGNSHPNNKPQGGGEKREENKH